MLKKNEYTWVKKWSSKKEISASYCWHTLVNTLSWKKLLGTSWGNRSGFFFWNLICNFILFLLLLNKWAFSSCFVYLHTLIFLSLIWNISFSVLWKSRTHRIPNSFFNISFRSISPLYYPTLFPPTRPLN